METFEITRDHLILAQGMFMDWCGDEYGAPSVDPKRPYGNSDVEEDICELLGWPEEPRHPDYEPYTDEQRSKARALHLEMKIVLQICLCTQAFIAARYQQKEKYDDTSWERL